MSEESRLTVLNAMRFRRAVGKEFAGDEDRTLHFAVRDARKSTELGAALNTGRVIEVAFQFVAFQPLAIVVRGEEVVMYLTDAQVGEHLQLLSQALDNALAT